MPNKNIFFNDEDIEKVQDTLVQHPELGSFTATVRWMIQMFQEPASKGKETAGNEERIVTLQSKLNAMSKEQQLQTQGLFNLLRAMNVETGKDISNEPTYLDARRTVNSQINQAVTAQSSHTRTHEIE